MPSFRVFSNTESYPAIPASSRHSIVSALRLMAADVLDEYLSGIEAFWMPPIDKASAVNTLPYWVDVELSASDDRTMGDLAAGVLAIFRESDAIPSDTQYGVWIKTPGVFHWDEARKP